MAPNSKKSRPTSHETLWLIDGADVRASANKFERHIASLLRAEYENTRQEVKVDVTAHRGKDGGFDISILSSIDLTFFGVTIKVGDKPHIKVLIDCKYTTKRTLRYDDIVCGISKISNADYFIIITNARIGVRTFYSLQEEARIRGVVFLAIERDALARNLADRRAPIGDIPAPLSEVPPITLEKDTVPRMGEDGHPSVTFFLKMSNPTAIKQSFSMIWTNTPPWQFHDSKPAETPKSTPLLIRTHSLAPGWSHAFRFEAKAEGGVGAVAADVLSMLVKWEGGGRVIDVVARDLAFDFQPDFIGTDHLATSRRIAKVLEGSTGFAFIKVVGEAGVGKSRVVQEALSSTSSNLVKSARVVIEAGTNSRTLAGIISGAVTKALDLEPPGLAASPSLITTLEQIADALDEPSKTLVLWIEDLHHAPPDIFTGLRLLWARRNNRKQRMVVIASGRQDFTFPNRDYDLFLCDVKADLPKKGRYYEHVPELNGSDARALIKNTVLRIPDCALDKIHRLSGDVPFNIIQCIEYLLDLKLAFVVNRAAVGIVDPAGFASRMRLPERMEEIFERRFDSLSGDEGELAQKCLLLCSIVGMDLPPGILGSLGGDPAEIRALLLSRRFLRAEGGHLEWVHENLRNHFRPKAEGLPELCRIALGKQEIFDRLDILRRGQIASLSGDHEAAVGHYSGMLDDVRNLTNFSTMDLPTSYYDHVPSAFVSMAKTEADKDVLSRLIRVGCWIGTNRLSIAECERAAQFGRAAIPKIGLSKKKANELNVWVRQIEAHSQLDSGKTAASRANLHEIECLLQGDKHLSSDHLLRFDLYNRLQALYGSYNHLELVEGYGRLAWQAAVDADNKELKAKQILDAAMWFQFIKPRECISMTRQALALNEREGTRMHTLLSQLSLAVAEAPQRHLESGWLDSEIKLAMKCLREARDGQHWSIQPRTYLTLGMLYYLAATRDERLYPTALSFIDAGIDLSVQYSIGFTYWQLYNMRAIVNLNMGNEDAAAESLETAIEILDNEDILFIGNADFTCANILVITNYMRFMARHQPSRISCLLPRLRTYDGVIYSSKEKCSNLNKTLIKPDYAIPFINRTPKSFHVDKKIGLAIAVSF